MPFPARLSLTPLLTNVSLQRHHSVRSAALAFFNPSRKLPQPQQQYRTQTQFARRKTILSRRRTSSTPRLITK